MGAGKSQLGGPSCSLALGWPSPPTTFKASSPTLRKPSPELDEDVREKSRPSARPLPVEPLGLLTPGLEVKSWALKDPSVGPRTRSPTPDMGAWAKSQLCASISSANMEKTGTPVRGPGEGSVGSLRCLEQGLRSELLSPEAPGQHAEAWSWLGLRPRVYASGARLRTWRGVKVALPRRLL